MQYAGEEVVREALKAKALYWHQSAHGHAMHHMRILIAFSAPMI